MKIKWLMILVLIVFSAVLHAADDKRFIIVNGDADVSVVPDRIVLSFGVNSEGKELEAVKKDNDTKIKKVIESLKKNGIAEKEIQAAQMMINQNFDYRDGRKFLGYSVARRVTVTLNDIKMYDKVVSEIVSAGTNNMYNTELQVSDRRKYSDEARALALKAAKEKAAAMAAVLGTRAGQVLEIQETGTPWEGRFYGAANVMAERGAGGSGEGTMTPGEIKIRASVTVKFELK